MRGAIAPIPTCLHVVVFNSAQGQRYVFMALICRSAECRNFIKQEVPCVANTPVRNWVTARGQGVLWRSDKHFKANGNF